jgi:CheY-like chemotaxis protein
VKILLADDDLISRRMLEGILAEWGHEVAAVGDGTEALRLLEESPPELAILDWMMPGLDGVEVCRRVRRRQTPTPVYLILLTSRNAKADVVAGLEAGANDYVTKPFDPDELRARVQVGRMVTELQASLAARVRELEGTLALVKQLQGLLPICSYCKKVRDDRNYWRQVEEYLSAHSAVRFSHGICPDCWRDVVAPQIREAERRGKGEA